jgi:hypothetical protein
MMVAAEILMEINKDSPMKLLLVDRAESVDIAATEQLLATAHAKGFQVMMARVARDGKASPDSILIEDGVVEA